VRVPANPELAGLGIPHRPTQVFVEFVFPEVTFDSGKVAGLLDRLGRPCAIRAWRIYAGIPFAAIFGACQAIVAVGVILARMAVGVSIGGWPRQFRSGTLPGAGVGTSGHASSE